ncbi:uncharacterized protein B52 isoform X2 [Epargyreus clarus]|uniref:uncharacterized protein B52 isoform X2 n=1 Tax=Epargyreus clarus TaxID=520877 RepID=UPI003C305AFB
MVGSRVYVGGLPFGVRDRDLEKFFKGFGRIRDILIKNGYGFVEFEDYRDADDAVYELNGKELLGERVVVEPARGIDRSADRYRRDRYYERDRGRSRYEYGPPTRTEYRLIVENLSSRISWQDLKDYMRQAGEVTYADAHKQHRNEGVVEFATHADMRAAIEKLDGTELNGRRIRLVEDRRSSRRRTRSSSSRSRSRSRDRRRSRSSRSRSKSRPKSKSPAAKSRSRSRSKCVKSCAEQNLKSDRSRSRSPSPSRKSERRSESRQSRDRERERERSASRKSPDRNGRRSRSRSQSKAESKERSRSRSKDATSPKRDEERRASKSRSRSRSRSGSRDRSASRDRSRSASPRQNGDNADRASTDRSPRSGD